MSIVDSFVIFELDQAAYGIRSSDVQHVGLVENITAVPNTAASVDGVVFSRGQVVPAINLRARFGLPRQALTPRSRLIFLKIEKRIVALLVDSARDFQRIPVDAIHAAQETLLGIAGNYVEGIVTVKNRNILILDVAAVLTIDEIQPSKEISEPASLPSA